MARIGEVHSPFGANSIIMNALISDIFMDRKYRLANHHELSNDFYEYLNGGYFNKYEHAWYTTPQRPAITGNFAGQDGSIKEYWLPPGTPNVWMDFPGFDRFPNSLYIPNDFIVEE
jgi:hypothetical protein